MARRKCPGCGKPYNGKRCGNCFYETFTEEIAHGGHTHEGEPLVVKTLVRNTPRPMTVFPGKSCNTFPGKRKKKPTSGKTVVVMLLIFLIMTIVSLAYEFVAEQMQSRIWEYAEPEPDITAFENGTVLYDANGVQVIAQWQDGDTCGESIPIYVRNDSKQDLVVSTDWVYLNGFLAEYSFFYCQADAGKSTVADLWLDPEDLETAGIKTVTEIKFQLDIYDSEDYEDFDQGPVITFSCDAPEDFFQPVDDSGDLLYQQDGVIVIYKGCTQEYCADGELRFFIENTTDETIQVYMEAAYVNGEEAPIYLWIELIPGTRGITESALYQLADMEIGSVSQIETLEMSLGIARGEDWDSWTQTDLLTVEVNG